MDDLRQNNKKAVELVANDFIEQENNIVGYLRQDNKEAAKPDLGTFTTI